ncbi:hypothetical protein LEP1GSC116_3343 [Leptospira interrogans serovar Icterohaemorrhagiae str. Verdun HP]|uniref:Uncharacterized protein n=1 Tax=Leptospira interrogans serovar Icterohaemorrhagiae str. Verdun HP TaxID=1049910 RepID=M6RDX3_LEPIR|nr:hypothetical protein LEP1GSC116_3343 [Leptospira interrogans serovar Icterohaemorrhagiae str. Verdun HP]
MILKSYSTFGLVMIENVLLSYFEQPIEFHKNAGTVTKI